MNDMGITRCLSCYGAFPKNESIEALPIGTRVAFDSIRGRLWVICETCSRWTLVPFESRWEALEALEHACHSSAKLLKQGENVALFRMGEMDIVRVGTADLHEQSWWRYGFGFLTRADRARALAKRGKIVHAAMWTVLFGIPFWGLYNPAATIERTRNRRFGQDIWKGVSRCQRCGDVLSSVRFAELDELILEWDVAGLSILYTCVHCEEDGETGHRWMGVSAQHVLRRGLAFQNFAGADRDTLNSAMTLIAQHHEPLRLLQLLGTERHSLGGLAVIPSLAVEISVNAGVEDELLASEVAAIEARWREEESIADIIDRELTPVRNTLRYPEV